jgi:tape measure domain-containing protein
VSVVANVAINLDATRARAAIAGLGGAVDKLGSSVSQVGQRMSGLAGIAASLGTGALVGGFVKAGIEADRTAKTINALAGQYGETAKVTEFANSAADRFGIGQTRAAQAVADLYGRLRPMNISLQDIQTTFIGVNNAAAKMNLSAADVEGVMLQLSQAMGSGALQGDELRSIMERLPAVGQAIAKTMGVTVGEIKKLGADGKITTDIIIKAMNELAGVKPPPPDPFKLFQKTLEDLNTTVGTKLLPAFTPLVQKISELVAKIVELGVAERIANSLIPLADVIGKLLTAFMNLSPEVQSFIIQVGAVGGAITLILAPLGSLLAGLGSLISVAGSVVAALGGMSFLTTIAGWLGAVVPAVSAVVSAIGTLGKILVAVFSGPVGWVVLLVAAGVALYAFRDQVGQVFGAVRDFIVKAFTGLADVVKAPFLAVANMIKGVLNQILAAIGNAINGAIGTINKLIAGANRALAALKQPQIPGIPQVSIPRFAKGGVVDRPTLAMIGEGGEREFVVPESKASQFAANWMSQAKGGPGTAVVDRMPTINLQTGPVLQQDDGSKYVSLGDLEKILQDFAAVVFNNARTAGGRQYQGVN